MHNFGIEICEFGYRFAVDSNGGWEQAWKLKCDFQKYVSHGNDEQWAFGDAIAMVAMMMINNGLQSSVVLFD